MRDKELATMPNQPQPSPAAPPPTSAQPAGAALSAIFNIPSVVWISLIAALTKWVSDSFPDHPLAPLAVIVLGAAAKAIQVYWPKPAPATNEAASAPPGAPAAPQFTDSGEYTWAAPTAPQRPESAGRKALRVLIG